MKVAVLGAGAYGMALGGILTSKGYATECYDPKLQGSRLSDVLDKAEYMVLSVPSFVAPSLLGDLPKDMPLVVATKGILTDKLFNDFDDWMVMSGPGFAKDIEQGKNTLLTATDKRIIELFGTDYLKFDETTDRLGVLMCGALKNVYAIMAGMLRLQKNTSSWQEYIVAVVKEMREILALNGANPATVELACGVGDLELTCDLPSRNYEFGVMISENTNASPEKTVEGLTTLGRIRQGEIKLPESAKIMSDILKLKSV